MKGRTKFVFEKWGMTRIMEPKRVEIKGDCGKLSNEKLRGFYSLDIVQEITSRRIN